MDLIQLYMKYSLNYGILYIIIVDNMSQLKELLVIINI